MSEQWWTERWWGWWHLGDVVKVRMMVRTWGVLMMFLVTWMTCLWLAGALCISRVVHSEKRFGLTALRTISEHPPVYRTSQSPSDEAHPAFLFV